MSVMRVPYTGWVLKRSVNKTLRNNKKPESTLTTAHEDSGDRLLHQAVKPGAFPSETCGGPTCQTIIKDLQGTCHNTCWQNHVNYTVFCKVCEKNRGDEDKKYVNIGESSRGCHTRYWQEREERFYVQTCRGMPWGRPDGRLCCEKGVLKSRPCT